jgi:hypothetical protein
MKLTHKRSAVVKIIKPRDGAAVRGARKQAMSERKSMFPDKPLGDPARNFEDTFSGEQVILDAFFPEATKK